MTQSAPESTNASPESAENTEANAPNSAQEKYRPLRIWPVALLLAGMAATRFIPGLTGAESMLLIVIMVLGPVLMGVGVLIWWMTFSRATWGERLAGISGAILSAGAAVGLSHSSMVGPGTLLIAVPLGTLCFAVAAILVRNRLAFNRTVVITIASACGFAVVTLMRSDGMWGDGALDWYWRWEPSAEERMLAERNAEPDETISNTTESEFENWISTPEWPRFRGPSGDSQNHGPTIDLDWTANPPELLWKIPVGPGWSSFVVAGNLLFTQEQLGQQEAVICYAADSGQEIWKHEIESRWDDPLGGPGPRATPTLADGALYAQGALGTLQRLDPMTGEVVWTRDIQKAAGCKPPEWGFSSSPLVIDSVVVVHAGDGKDTGKVLGFDVDSGELSWSVESGSHSYGSAESCEMEGQNYVSILTNAGMNLLQSDGSEVLNYAWAHGGYRALQPQVVGDSVLIATQELGTRRVRFSNSDSGFNTEEVWTSRHLKPDFNDFVIFEEHAYGFDGMILTCIDLETGDRKWKGGRYGKGQMLLMKNSGALLVASEKGEAVLVKADPSGYDELAKFQAIDGKTWNHPVVVEDRLYIRNSQQAACYRLPLQ